MPPPAWWQVERTSGGQMVEQVTHLFDLVRVLLGEPTSIFAAGCRCERAEWPDSDIDEVSTATLRFDSPAVATISATCILDAPHRVGLQVVAEGLSIDLTEDRLTIEGRRRETRAAAVDPFWLEDRAFLDAVRGDRPGILAAYADALETHRVASQAAVSARTGGPIDLTAARHG
jgi:predicted dehydrogenase